MDDLVGKTFNLLTVIRKSENQKKGQGVYWECKCECGNITTARTTDLLNGIKKSCGCLKYKKNDLTGKTFGKLTVIKKSDTRISNVRTWECRCECGNTVLARTGDLISGAKTSCGCGNAYRTDLSGQTFNLLTVIKKKSVDKKGKIIWECKCECGNITTATTTQLKSGSKKSCGCLKNKSHAKDLKGQVFGMLKVIKRVGTENRRAVWRCKCECGKYCNVRSIDLLSGNTKSCGCLGKAYAQRNLREGGYWYDW